MTFFYKFVFTAVFVGGFGLGTVGMFLSSDPEAEQARWWFPLVWLASTGFLWWTCARLKRVRIGVQGLKISNYGRTVTVPFQDVVSVTQHVWVSTKPITLGFARDTPFGRSVLFMPPLSYRLLIDDPIVGQLRDLAGIREGRPV